MPTKNTSTIPNKEIDIEHEYADVLKLLADHGYHALIADGPGGNYKVMEISLTTTTGNRILIGDKDGPLAEERANHDGWYVGFFDHDNIITHDVQTDDGSAKGLLKLMEQLAQRWLPRVRQQKG